MSNPRCELLRWQFNMSWALFEYHLERLAPDDFLWEPTDMSWTVRPDTADPGCRTGPIPSLTPFPFPPSAG